MSKCQIKQILNFFLYSDCAIKEPTRAAQNMEDAKRLWEISEKLVNVTSDNSTESEK